MSAPRRYTLTVVADGRTIGVTAGSREAAIKAARRRFNLETR